MYINFVAMIYRLTGAISLYNFHECLGARSKINRSIASSLLNDPSTARFKILSGVCIGIHRLICGA